MSLSDDLVQAVVSLLREMTTLSTLSIHSDPSFISYPLQVSDCIVCCSLSLSHAHMHFIMGHFLTDMHLITVKNRVVFSLCSTYEYV